MFESTGFDDDLYYYMFSPNKCFSGEIIFYDRDLLKTLFKVEFHKAYVVGLEERFNHNDNLPLHINLAITCGAIKARDAKKIEKWVPEDPFKEVAPTVIEEVEEETEEQKETDLKFTASFERLDSYQGEFGFDWMRDNYNEICNDYAKLKKEYTPTTIEGREYFVPWLSMFPNQKNVTLKLSITELEGKAKDTDIIKLSSEDGVKFEPNEFKVSEANGKEITITCEKPLKKDTPISLFNKDDKEVGRINIFKNANHEQLHFNITPVRILRSVDTEHDKETIEKMMDLGFGDSGKDIAGDLKNLETYLNEHSLNQALLKCSIGKVYDVVINEDKWIDDDLIIDDGCVFKGNLLDIFEKKFKEQHPKAFKNRGITVFLSPLKNVKEGEDGLEEIGGYGNIGDIDSKNLAIFYSNLWNKETFAHEIAHVAGLEHSFKEKENLNDLDVFERNRFIKQVDQAIQSMIEDNYPKKDIADFWNKHKKNYAKYRSQLNIYYRNLHKFKKTQTDNFMDYYNKRKAFWKFQWKALQDDVLKFYKQ